MATKIELLAPARDAATARAAIMHGADAIYIGAPSHGARAAASNSLDDLRSLVDMAHSFNVRIYATVNTLVYDHELSAVERMVRGLYTIGVDALIVQDMALLRLDIPPIELHASTQCDIRTPERAQFLAECGFSQLVLPREMSVDEMRRVRRALPPEVALEAFVHGALCVSYSGDCQAGFATHGRSANRGECPQICRLPYSLTDMDGNTLAPRGHFLSMRDLNRSASLEAMLHAGISSFKIEGRLKEPNYVKNITAFYHRALNEIIARNPDQWQRASAGGIRLLFDPDPAKSFNRGFTTYFTDGIPAARVAMASVDSPKWTGEVVGKVLSTGARSLRVRASRELHNGDGLGFYDAAGNFFGFRLNRVDGATLHTATAIPAVAPGTPLRRNRDKQRDDMMEGSTAQRSIGIDVTFDITPDRRPTLTATDCRGNRVGVATPEPCDAVGPARSPQSDPRRKTIEKTGDTIYCVQTYTDRAPDCFVPMSVVAQLRRDLTDALDSAQRTTYRFGYRRTENRTAIFPEPRLSYHNNVANRLARDFYLDHGVESIEPALEVAPDNHVTDGTRVMTTRYCLRRELGECLTRDPKISRRFPDGPLLLRPCDNAGDFSLRVDFDCARCQCHIYLHRPS